MMQINKVSITSDIIIIAKLAIKSYNITPFGGLYSVFNRFSASGLREIIDSHLGKRSSDPKAFTYSDVFAFLFGNYICGGVENRDANTHVKFHQKDTLERIITRIEKQSKVVIHNFRADCGSFSSSILEYVKDHCERFSSNAKETLVHKVKKTRGKPENPRKNHNMRYTAVANPTLTGTKICLSRFKSSKDFESLRN